MESKQTNGLYEFASFRLDVKNCRLTRAGDIISLTPKEFDLLLYLIENGGRVVKKDELLDRIWQDAFVEEATLTRNISWLRKKLADGGAAGDGKIIETVPKRGYRFLPEVVKRRADALVIEEEIVQQIQIEEIIEIKSPPNAGEELIQARHEFQETPPAVISAKETNKATKVLRAAPFKRIFSNAWILLAALVLTVAGFAVFRGYFSPSQPKIILAPKIAPFSGLPGRESDPSFSPDGKQIVYSWDGTVENGNSDIYVKLVSVGDPIRLTMSEQNEIDPVFSPDGKSIAFVRVFADHNEIILISALGGAERRIYDRASYASLSFSPDGQFLAHANLDSSNNDAGIFTINLQTGEKTRLTVPDAPAVDHTPRFSPDGKSLAFIRYFSSFRREIFVIPAGGGEARQITSDDARIYGLAWNADGEKIFFTSFRAGNQLNLWQVSAAAKEEPQLIPTGARDLQSVAISPNEKTIAFVEETADENIWQIEPDKAPRPLIRSTRADHSQQFSPDGATIAFASDRTGNYEIWLADADGKNQRQLTDAKTSAGSPRFSPDGKFVAYDAQISGGSDVYLISASGGAVRRLTEDGKNNSLPAWSADGQWIFFISNRSGSDQIWKMPVGGGEAAQLTKEGAFEMFAAPDGKRIIYSKGGGKPGLWSVGTNGGDEQSISELADAGVWRSWFVASSGVYYTAFATQPPFRVKFFDFATGQTREISTIEKSPLSYYQNLSVSPDGKKLLYARQDQSASAIMLAELE